jgi:hypothetical protein
MTLVEMAVLFLCAERAFAMGCGFYRGARAAWRASQPPREASVPTTYTKVPDFVEVASDDVMALDYSAKSKRH